MLYEQVDVTLTFHVVYFPTDLNIDDNANKKQLLKKVDTKIDKIIEQIYDATNLIPDEIIIDINKNVR